jgi:hypothetical protein
LIICDGEPPLVKAGLDIYFLDHFFVLSAYYVVILQEIEIMASIPEFVRPRDKVHCLKEIFQLFDWYVPICYVTLYLFILFSLSISFK